MKITTWGWEPPAFELVGDGTVRIVFDLTTREVNEGGRTITEWICRTEDIIDDVLFDALQKDPKSLSANKKILREKILAYDVSPLVNIFTFRGYEMWYDKSKRAGLRLRFEAELHSGKINTTLWYGGTEHELLVSDAIGLLDSIELYAAKCYDITQKHLRNVDELTTVEECMAYNYKEGYPEKLVL